MEFRGVFTALVTPFEADSGDVNYSALGQLLEKQIAAGVAGVVPCGTTGESPALSHPEHDAVVRYTVEQVAGRALVMAGTGSNSTREAVRLTRTAEESGADAALVVTPYYNKPSPEGLFRYYKAISEESSLPLVVYNIQGRTGVNVDTETLARIAELPTVVGVKEASGNLDQMAAVMERLSYGRPDDQRFWVLSGDDSLTLPLMGIGGHGVVSVVSNLVPEQVVAMVQAALDNDFSTAREVYYRLQPLFRAAFIETNPVPIKAAMEYCGLSVGRVRSPLCELLPQNEKRLLAVLEAMGLGPGAKA